MRFLAGLIIGAALGVAIAPYVTITIDFGRLFPSWKIEEDKTAKPSTRFVAIP